jgi:hypothetical protein
MPVNRPKYSFLELENKDELKSDARSAFDKAREYDLNSDPRAALPEYSDTRNRDPNSGSTTR